MELQLPNLDVPPFDPQLHISPFRLFRRLHDAREGRAEAPVVLDVREAPGPGALRIAGAVPFGSASGNPLSEDREIVLIDDDGRRALDMARRLREEGRERVWALYGGLTLYDFALDPLVVGAERFLIEASGDG